MQHELLATILEEVSVLASDQRRPEPLEWPRPYERPDRTKKPAEGLVGDAESGFTATGLGGILALSEVYGVSGGA